MIDDTLASSDSSFATVAVSDSTSSTEKRTLGAKAGCSLPKLLKCENSASVTSLIVIASSSTAPTKYLPAENHTKGSIADKFVKCITVSDSQSENNSTVSSAEVWVKFRRKSLTMEDKSKIENGSKLTDKHINLLIH